MRVVLAVDASPDSKNAAQVIRHLADPPVLDVLNVVDEDALKHAYISPQMPAEYLETYRREVTEVAEQVLHEMKAEMEPLCRHIRLIADSGDAADAVVPARRRLPESGDLRALQCLGRKGTDGESGTGSCRGRRIETCAQGRGVSGSLSLQRPDAGHGGDRMAVTTIGGVAGSDRSAGPG